MMFLQIERFSIAISLLFVTLGFCSLYFMPVSAYALLDSIEILSNATNNLLKFCFSGMEPNEETMRNNANKSLMLAIGAIPLIGYEAAASVVKEALAKGVPVIDLLRQKNLMSSEEIDSLCNPRNMINNN